MSEAIEGDLLGGDSIVGDKSSLEKMQALVNKHEETGLLRVENKELRGVLDEIRNVGLSNIIDMFDTCPHTGDLRIKPLELMSRDVMAGVKSIKVKRDRIDGDLNETVEFVMHDKMAALDKLMRFYGAYAADNSQKSTPADEMLDLMVDFIGGQGLPVLEDNDA